VKTGQKERKDGWEEPQTSDSTGALSIGWECWENVGGLKMMSAIGVPV